MEEETKNAARLLGLKGGNSTLDKYGKEYYKKIRKMGTEKRKLKLTIDKRLSK